MGALKNLKLHLPGSSVGTSCGGAASAGLEELMPIASPRKSSRQLTRFNATCPGGATRSQAFAGERKEFAIVPCGLRPHFFTIISLFLQFREARAYDHRSCWEAQQFGAVLRGRFRHHLHCAANLSFALHAAPYKASGFHPFSVHQHPSFHSAP